MARSIGIQTDRMKILGLVLSNGLIGLSGALIAQNDGYADVSKGNRCHCDWLGFTHYW